jgi:hypothetical protein
MARGHSFGWAGAHHAGADGGEGAVDADPAAAAAGDQLADLDVVAAGEPG